MSGLGKGHSNLPESTFSVLTKFRAKDVNLHQKHYYASTNLGLIQANMTWCFKRRGPYYRWIVDLYSRLGLPLLDGIQEMVSALIHLHVQAKFWYLYIYIFYECVIYLLNE